MIKQSTHFSFQGEKIPYDKYIQTFNGQEKAYFYVVNLADATTREKVLKTRLLTSSGFEDFADSTIAEDFYHLSAPVRLNINLVFLLPDEFSLTDDMYEIRSELDYGRRLFIKSSELPKLITEKPSKERNFSVSLGPDEYKLRNFNITSDSRLLNNLSEALQSPIINVSYQNPEEAISSINKADKDALAYYYQKLWSMFQEIGVPENSNRISSTERKLLYLASVLSNQTPDTPLLLDYLGWNGLDDYRRLNLISTLGDFSEQAGSVILTCESRNDCNLMQRKLCNPNFITPKRF
ncbi:MAG: hypothetical protein K2J20_02255 [Bacilli bacterium]|nr:hypothetical protein [Bacilli bacterium]